MIIIGRIDNYLLGLRQAEKGLHGTRVLSRVCATLGEHDKELLSLAKENGGVASEQQFGAITDFSNQEDYHTLISNK